MRRSRSSIAGIILLVIGFVLLLVTGASLIASFVASPGTIQPGVLRTNAALSTISKLALIATAIALIRNARALAAVATAGLCVSLVDSAYYLLAVIPRLPAQKSKEEAFGHAFGAALPMILSAAVYVSIILYARWRRPEQRTAVSQPTAAP